MAATALGSPRPSALKLRRHQEHANIHAKRVSESDQRDNTRDRLAVFDLLKMVRREVCMLSEPEPVNVNETPGFRI